MKSLPKLVSQSQLRTQGHVQTHLQWRLRYSTLSFWCDESLFNTQTINLPNRCPSHPPKKRRAKAFKEWEGEEGIANGADRHTVISVPFWWPYKSTNYTRNGQRMLRVSLPIPISISVSLTLSLFYCNNKRHKNVCVSAYVWLVWVHLVRLFVYSYTLRLLKGVY